MRYIVETDFDKIYDELSSCYLAEGFYSVMVDASKKPEAKRHELLDTWVDWSKELGNAVNLDPQLFSEYLEFLYEIYISRQNTRFLDRKIVKKQVDAHHIVPRSWNRQLENNLTNLIALDREQHIEAHSKLLLCILKTDINKKALTDMETALAILDKYKLKDDLTEDEYSQFIKDLADRTRKGYLANRYAQENQVVWGRGKDILTDKSNIVVNWLDKFNVKPEDNGPFTSKEKLAQAIERVITNYNNTNNTEKLEIPSSNTISNWFNTTRKYENSWRLYFKERPENRASKEDKVSEQPYIAFIVPAGKIDTDFNDGFEIAKSGRELAKKMKCQVSTAHAPDKATENHNLLINNEIPDRYYARRDKNAPGYIIIFAKDLDLLNKVCNKNGIVFKDYEAAKEAINKLEADIKDSPVKNQKFVYDLYRKDTNELIASNLNPQDAAIRACKELGIEPQDNIVDSAKGKFRSPARNRTWRGFYVKPKELNDIN